MEEKDKKLIHKLNLESRKNLEVSGVEKVISSNPSCIYVKLSETNLEVNGTELSIITFVDNKIEIKGNIDCIKYSKTSRKKDCIFKRIFK